MNPDVFNKWLGNLGKAWILKDPDAVVELCSRDVKYYEEPFRKPLIGLTAVRNVWLEVPTSQKDIKFKYDILSIADNKCIAHWHATFTRLPSEIKADLDGIYFFKLNSAGLCNEFHQWWNSR